MTLYEYPLFGLRVEREEEQMSNFEHGEESRGHQYSCVVGGLEVVKIGFQVGPVKENGRNGCQNADILEVLIDRYEWLQEESGFPCEENMQVLTMLRGCLELEKRRDALRAEQGVEGEDKAHG